MWMWDGVLVCGSNMSQTLGHVTLVSVICDGKIIVAIRQSYRIFVRGWGNVTKCDPNSASCLKFSFFAHYKYVVYFSEKHSDIEQAMEKSNISCTADDE